METTFKGIIKTSAVLTTTRRTKRERNSEPPTLHVSLLTTYLPHQTDQYETCKACKSQMNHVERLFPEFFRTCCSDTSFVAESKRCVNPKLNQTPDETLIRSWLHLYGAGSDG